MPLRRRAAPSGGGADFGQVGEAVFQRAEEGVERVGLAASASMWSIVTPSAASKGPDQGRRSHEDMAKAAKRAPKVAGDGADIAALAADHFQIDMVGVGAGDQGQAFHPERAGGEVHLLAFAGEVIGAFAVDLDGGKLRRGLQDVAAEGCERGCRSRRRWGGGRLVGDDVACGVVGVGGAARSGTRKR